MFEETIAWRGEAGYEEARAGPVFNARRPDRHPAGVARPRTEDEVVAAVAVARARGLSITVRGGGHSWAAWALRDDALLIDLGAMREIELDEETGIVSVSPSVRGGDELAPRLAAHGRMFPGGHCPSVGLGGFLLQGGQGWNCRRLGWACESIRAVDVVTADAELVHASETENPDLLWAARGAGPGFFGAVTRFHLQTYPAPQAMSQSNHIYSMAAFDDVMAWAHEVLPTLDPLVEPVIAATFAPHQAAGVRRRVGRRAAARSSTRRSWSTTPTRPPSCSRRWPHARSSIGRCSTSRAPRRRSPTSTPPRT